MMLRLALVGIVAALGVTLPSQTDCDHWLLSSERWVSSVLADWDTWTPREHAAGTDLVATTDHECEQCRLARLELARSEESAVGSTVTESVPTVASSPVVIVEKRSDRPDRASLAPTESNRLSTFDPVAFTMDFDAESAVKLDDDVKGLGVAEALGRLTALDAHAEWAELAERLELALPDQVWEAALHEENTLVRWRPVATDPTEPDPRNAEPRTASTEPVKHVSLLATHVQAASVVELAPLQDAFGQTVADAYGLDVFESVARQMEAWVKERPRPAVDPLPNAPLIAEAPKAQSEAPSTDRVTRINTEAAAVVVRDSSPAPETTITIPWPVFSSDVQQAASAAQVAQATSVPWPVFAPVEATVVQDSAIGVDAGPLTAAELSAATPSAITSRTERAPEPGFASSSSAPAASADQPAFQADTECAQAIRLTQQAMRAWIGVLVGQARVEVTAR
jgi:hypothetical protein